MSYDGISITSAEIAEKLEKKKISASLVTDLLQGCPAAWVAKSFVLRDNIEEEPDNALRRGSMFHKVMEDFFAHPAEERTAKLIKSLVHEVLNEGEFADLGQQPEAVKWLRGAVNGYWNMEEKPEEVVIAEIPTKRGNKPGLEVFVAGQIGEASRSSLGFIDRVSQTEDGGVRVEDWKSGAKAKVWNPKTKSTDGLGEARQQIIYTMLLEQMGVNVTGARLIFPVAGKIVNVDTTDEAFRKRVVADVEEADRKLDVLIETNKFEFSPSALCAWCPLAKLCPEAQILPNPKMRKAFDSQPGPEVLMKGIDLQ